MNRDLVDWIWKHSAQTDLNRLVQLALAHRSNLVGEATITLDDLADMCKAFPADVRESLRMLVKADQITIFQNQDKDGKRTTNTYKSIVGGLGRNGEEDDDIQFSDPPLNLPGIPAPKVSDVKKDLGTRVMMDGTALAAISADPLYEGLDVNKEAWRFKRWCAAHGKETTVRRFKQWLARV